MDENSRPPSFARKLPPVQIPAALSCPEDTGIIKTEGTADCEFYQKKRETFENIIEPSQFIINYIERNEEIKPEKI